MPEKNMKELANPLASQKEIETKEVNVSIFRGAM